MKLQAVKEKQNDLKLDSIKLKGAAELEIVYVFYCCKEDWCSFQYGWFHQIIRMNCTQKDTIQRFIDLNHPPILPLLLCAVVSSQRRASQTVSCYSDWTRRESPVRWCGLHSPPGPSGSPEHRQDTQCDSVPWEITQQHTTVVAVWLFSSGNKLKVNL